MLTDRFWSKVEKGGSEDCWLWTANKNNKGYGMFSVSSVVGKKLAHRLAYADAKGKIPKGGLILHSCDNPACVNPSHLRIGSHRENVADMDIRGRRCNHTLHGAQLANAKLTDEAVIAIRQAYIAGCTVEAIAADFGISTLSVHDITGGRSWPHVFAMPGCPTREELKAKAAQKTRNNARINQDIADTIRQRLANGETGKDLAVEYGIHKATISDIKKRKIWRG